MALGWVFFHLASAVIDSDGVFARGASFTSAAERLVVPAFPRTIFLALGVAY